MVSALVFICNTNAEQQMLHSGENHCATNYRNSVVVMYSQMQNCRGDEPCSYCKENENQTSCRDKMMFPSLLDMELPGRVGSKGKTSEQSVREGWGRRR